MKIFAMSDLHLPSARNIHQGDKWENWKNHTIKMRDNWVKNIKKDDVVLIPGDLSCN